MKTSILKTPAKINLFLKITGKRPDGYHNIYTLFQKISLFDSLEIGVQPGPHKINLVCSDPSLPSNSSNLAWRAAELFLTKSGLNGSISIKLDKEIPAGAGLGGGSSDAAAVLKGLNKLYGNPLDQEELLTMGKALGADVPFFITNWNAAIGTETGTNLRPVQPSNSYYVLVWPGFSVSTKWAYENFILTSNKETTIFGPGQGFDKAFLWQNDLEKAVFKRYPVLQEIKFRLKQAGAVYTLMSGSGSVIFGEFSDKDSAIKGLSLLPADQTWKTYVVNGLQ